MPLSRKTIVAIIDDDTAVRDALAAVLSGGGYQVVTFCSAARFLSAFESFAPDCLVVDVAMPTINGLDLVKALRAGGVTTPVIMMSGNADIALHHSLRVLGVASFLKKPFGGAQLLGAVQKLAL